jgi:hypothetical protein
MAMRASWAVFVLAPLVLLSEGTARADAPISFGPGLRPFVHTDRFGRTLVDVCPDRGQGARRCFSQRILKHGEPIPVPLSGGGSCTATGTCKTDCTTPEPSAMTPTDVLAAYSIPASTSAGGAIVALVDLPSTNAMTDVNTYRTYFGIPTLPACPVNSAGVPTPGGVACFARVGTDATVNTVTTTDCPGWSGETALDIEMVSAACPDCSIVVVEAVDAFGSDLDQMDPIAASPLLASAVSNSWGGPEYPGDDQTFYDSPGILTLASSGDDGYLMEDESANAPDFPASSAYVMAVGGTTLYKSGGGVYSEAVWDDDGLLGGGGSTTSGCSMQFTMPSWQSASPFNFGTCKMRATVDISAAAEFYPPGKGGGIAVYAADIGGWESFVGTSASSPMVAAIMVRLGLGGKDQHTLFYQNGGAFNDVTSGNNDSLHICGGTVLCTAGKQWDGPTGLGSPNGTLLLALAGGTLEPEPDAGPLPMDSGTTEDSGGTDDAGEKKDAGVEAHDSGSHPKHDAGSDAGEDGGSHKPAGGPVASSGCSCRTAPRQDLPWSAVLAFGGVGMLGVQRLRRRARRP